MITEERYQTPLTSRYASEVMSTLFSCQNRYTLWRKLWIALAEAEKELGLSIKEEQIAEMKQHLTPIDFSLVTTYEKELKHDVMAHIHAWGDKCQIARPIIHLGATSCYVTDNSDLIQMKEGMQLLLKKLTVVIEQLTQFADQYKELPTLGFTHYQPAQLTTVGKRACIWIQDLLMDLSELKQREASLQFLGVKGATGTQASFLSLFNGDHERVKQLDNLVAKKMGFTRLFPISGQTYTRKLDTLILKTLSGIGESAHKLATDLRLLANLKEVEEPFGKQQIGSSAMPYKRNPMLSERICSLSRFLISLPENCSYTHATQWFERTLDDSANRRLAIAEAFLSADAVLCLLQRVTKGLVVYPKVIQKHIQNELPFMATENILMQAVKKGGDRQELHERIRQHSVAAAKNVKENGLSNDLLERITSDSTFNLSKSELLDIISEKEFIGRAKEQVEEFIEETVHPTINNHSHSTEESLFFAPQV